MDFSKVKIEVKMATSWARAKECALQTIGKKMATLPDDEWERKMLMCQHSPIRMVEYDIKICGVPQWVTVHLVRHFIGCEKFVRTQREDRNPNVKNRDELPQGELNDMTFVANAEALINISKRRLCGCASPETRKVWSMVRDAIREVDPIMADFMVPSCIYRSFCPEIIGCGYDKSEKFREEWKKYRSQKKD